jgi:hypothetical protein
MIKVDIKIKYDKYLWIERVYLMWTEPNLAVIHGHYLDALGPFLRHYPDAVAGVVSKLFELLTSLPITFQVQFLLCYNKFRSIQFHGDVAETKY